MILKKCMVVGAGDFFETKLPLSKGDFLIAADGGLNYLNALNIHPDLVVGDMDSVKVQYKEENHKIFSIKKDDTDTLIAVNEGLKMGYRHFFIFGGTGGRIDHSLANIKILEYLANSGARGFLFSKNEVITAIKNSEILFPQKYRGTFSIFAMGGDAVGILEKGSEYELLDYNLKSDSSIGVSNHFCGKEVRVSVREGRLLVVFQRQGEYKIGF